MPPVIKFAGKFEKFVQNLYLSVFNFKLYTTYNIPQEMGKHEENYEFFDIF